MTYYSIFIFENILLLTIMKKIYLLGLLTLTLNAQAQIPSSGLIGSWPFNGNANDESPNSNHGMVNGATLTADRFGTTSSAYYFDGIDDYIDLGNDPALDRFNTDFTISAWINPNTVTPEYGRPIFTNRLNGGGSEFYIEGQLNNKPGNLGFVIYDGSGYSHSYSPTAIGINDGFHHVVMVYQHNGSSQNICELYIDNILVERTTGMRNIVQPNVNTYIGYMLTFENNRHFKGVIDDIFLYNRAIDQNEIDSLFNDGVSSADISSIEKNENLTIYPNPTNQSFSIFLGNFATKMEVQILNTVGQTIFIGDFSNVQKIDLNIEEPKGIYFVKVRIDGKEENVLRLLKN
jgi:hypothetical protein